MSRITEVIHIGQELLKTSCNMVILITKTQWPVMHIVLYINIRHKDMNLEFV